MLALLSNSEELHLAHSLPNTLEDDTLGDNCSLTFCSPERPSLSIRHFSHFTATSPTPDSNSELVTSLSLNASIEYNQSDEDKNFETLLTKDKFEIPFEDFGFPKITNAKAGIQLLELSAEWKASELQSISQRVAQQLGDYLPQSISRPFGFHRESPIHSVQFPKLEKRIDYPIVIESDSEEDELHFEEVKGKFQIIEKIGEGTFSSVYKAVSIENQKVVALKRIYATCRPSRILNEIQHLKTLGGKCFVTPMLGGLRHRDQVTLILPYFEHDKFKDYLFTLSLQQIKDYIRALFISLHHLHQNGIIHRDIKPGNFLYNMKANEFMLVDFGLAQLQSEMVPPPQTPTTTTTPTSPSQQQQQQNTTNSTANSTNSTTTVQFSGPMTRKRSSALLESKTLDNSKKLKIEQQPITQQQQQPTSPSTLIPPSQYPSLNVQQAYNNVQLFTNATAVSPLQQLQKKPMQAPRAGTRGFRAPEVLLKYPYQTTAIDVWSAGIIFLCMLSMRYPFFNSPDDLSALVEIAALCGSKQVQDMASSLSRKVSFPIDFPQSNLKYLCTKLSGSRSYVVPDSAYDLLEKCLELHPDKRITAFDALKHPFLADSS